MKNLKISIVIIAVFSLLLALFILVALPKNDIKPRVKKKAPVNKPILQKEILTYKGIDSVLNTFEKVTYNKLNQVYINKAGYEESIYSTTYLEQIKEKIFYKIVGRDVLKILVGKFKVIDFLPKDDDYYRNLKSINSNYAQYLVIDSEVLHRLLDLLLLLKKSGFNENALTINYAFRYPAFNTGEGGAPLSQHIYGKAIDLLIGDINKDGEYDETTDKQIVLDILEEKIFIDFGGIGRYSGTNIVHFDTRPVLTIWDQQ